jgi:inorganic phosphate transporter, PiT family
MSLSLIVLVALALIYTFLNGLNDSSNIAATVISSRAMGGRSALMMVAAGVFIGPFLLGVAVATTIANDIVDPTQVTVLMLLAALFGAILFGLATTLLLGIPSSSTHALVGGLVGAAWAGAGWEAVQWMGLIKVLAALFLSPVAGMAAGFLITRLVFFLARNATPRANGTFKRGQVFTSMVLAITYGANDAQKTMGVITLGLVAGGFLSSFEVPRWVVIVSASGIALGSAVGGWRLIRTMGGRFYKIRPLHAFCTQAAADTIVLGASLIGAPVSTTQVVSTSIMGVGAAERINKVRWGTAFDIILAWIVTIPINILLAAGVYWLIHLFMPLS